MILCEIICEIIYQLLNARWKTKLIKKKRSVNSRTWFCQASLQRFEGIIFESRIDPRDFLNEAPVINRFPQILLPTFLFQPSDGRHFCREGTTPAGQIFQKDTPRYSHASIQAHDINNRINNRRNRRSATASGKKLMRAGFMARVLEPSTNHLRRRLGLPLPSRSLEGWNE